MGFAEYNDSLLDPGKVGQQIAAKEFDDQQYIFTLDVSVIGTGFGQLVDDGNVDEDAKPIVGRALARQILWAQLQADWSHSGEYVSNLKVLQRVLKQA